MDNLTRGQIMPKLLHHHVTSVKKCQTIQVLGAKVDPTMCVQLLVHLRAWSEIHKVNSRPSINASSYMILRSPSEFEQPPKQQQSSQGNDQNKVPPTVSKEARIAAKKLKEF
mmetsp:Transcript_62575/g.75301  ORF Transcript_62575/g.75301 Transcript_62575/m.75301 type:complete len:112 (-) Transcript_62575:228-563(-)